MGQIVTNIPLDYEKQKKLKHPELEKYCLIEAAAKLIKAETKLLSTSMVYYPSSSEIASEEKNKKFLSSVLQHFLNTIIGTKACDLKKISIGQALVQASRPRSLISAILFDVGVQLNQDLAPNVDVPPGHFCWWIADNVDHNIATTDGHNTFHGRGIIMCKSGPLSEKPNILSEKKVNKAYSSAVRGHILLSSVFTSVLLQDVLGSNLQLSAKLSSEAHMEPMDVDEIQSSLPNLQSLIVIFQIAKEKKLFKGTKKDSKAVNHMSRYG
ncbi:hypothetical protein ILUMI_20148 [Ignelater luminosus]|uniref:Uncharacterized protein n=1 Tax=Ignelater luminosus TaxID=2038154 RepID=A0A8K0CES8_IGNLU|nr:hypothetical protein ILUMI_20148 [Ignelater luminosus]